jgi:hypothetical protein
MQLKSRPVRPVPVTEGNAMTTPLVRPGLAVSRHGGVTAATGNRILFFADGWQHAAGNPAATVAAFIAQDAGLDLRVPTCLDRR